MLNLAAFRYRNVLAEQGGPVVRIEQGDLPVRGRRLPIANAFLKPELVQRMPSSLFSSADGTGLHPVPSIARHMAVSEALERWAFSDLVRSDRAEQYGFDADPSSSGMAAFPGLVGRQARARAVLESIERHSLMAWWEGLAEGRLFETDWPGVSAVAIDGPFGGITVVAYAKSQWGYAYGHAAGESFSAACERAVLELGRHEWVLRSWWLSCVAGKPRKPANLFERRVLFFATEDGHGVFRRRIDERTKCAIEKPDILCDCELVGPWSDYTTVWRFALRPPSDGHLRGGDSYFFL